MDPTSITPRISIPVNDTEPEEANIHTIPKEMVDEIFVELNSLPLSQLAEISTVGKSFRAVCVPLLQKKLETAYSSVVDTLLECFKDGIEKKDKQDPRLVPIVEFYSQLKVLKENSGILTTKSAEEAFAQFDRQIWQIAKELFYIDKNISSGVLETLSRETQTELKDFIKLLAPGIKLKLNPIGLPSTFAVRKAVEIAVDKMAKELEWDNTERLKTLNQILASPFYQKYLSLIKLQTIVLAFINDPTKISGEDRKILKALLSLDGEKNIKDLIEIGNSLENPMKRTQFFVVMYEYAIGPDKNEFRKHIPEGTIMGHILPPCYIPFENWNQELFRLE